MSIEKVLEDFIRKIVREELGKLSGTAETTAVEEQTEEQSVSSSVSNTAEMIMALKDLCSSNVELAKKAKALITTLGYEQFSAVPDDEADEIFQAVLRRLNA